MKAFVSLAVALSFLLTSCTTPGMKTAATSEQTTWTNVRYSSAKGSRQPASGRDFIREIEQATGKTYQKWLADESVVDAGTRMKKVFEFARNEPEAFFSQLRHERPILASKGAKGMVFLKGEKKIPNIYLVTKYRDVQEVLDHNEVFSVRPYADIMDATVGSPYMLGRERTSANEEKPDMHHAVDGRGNSVKVRAIVRHLAREALRNGAHNGEIDVVKEVSRAVPLGLNEQYFGLNGPSREALARWSRATQHAFFHNPFKDEKVAAASIQAGKEMREWIGKSLIPARRRELANGRPANDAVSLVLALGDLHRQAGFSEERIVANIIGLLVGSVETTSAAVSQSLQFLMNNPEILARAKAAAIAGDDALVSRYVWEALRFDPVNPWLGRYSESDYVLGRGTPYETLIPKGSLVLASTESAMWDEEVFTNPSSFDISRDPSKYMHLGYGYHRCLGDDVSLVMVPETVKQILLLPGLRKGTAETAIDQKGGPFPESYVLKFDQTVEFPAASPRDISQLMSNELLGEFAIERIANMQKRREAVRAIQDALGNNPEKKAKAIYDLPGLVVNAMDDHSEAERTEACMDKNPKSVEVFPNLEDRRNYCSIRLDFRACYFVQRLIAKQSGFTSYYHCAYDREFLSPTERERFKQQFSKSDLFYFLALEGGR